jgi:RNA polymerase sigma factor (TIGR02999 family)
MPNEVPGEVTRLLEEIATTNDNKNAKRALFDLVYNELKQMAQGRMRWERPDHSWGATGLVHEVYLHLMTWKCENVFTKNRAYFFGAAAIAMGRLLREHARARQSRTNGHLDPGGRTLLDQLADQVKDNFSVDLLDLVDALEELKTRGEHGERRYDVATLRIWSGLKYSEIAEYLGISVATVQREWPAVRAWLYGRLKERSIND